MVKNIRFRNNKARILAVILFLISISIMITSTGCSMSHVVKYTKSPQAIPVLMYHHLVPSLEGYEGNEAVLSVQQFQEQMAYLAQEGFTTLTVEQLLEYLEAQKELPEKAVVITFDDGYESNYTYGYPALKENGLHAIIHIIVAVIPGESEGERPGIPKLTWEQMREMMADGIVDIQSHTYDSHHYAAIDKKGSKGPALSNKLWLEDEGRIETEEEYRERIREDLRLTQEIIKARLGREVTAIAYPYGASNDVVRQIAREELGFSLGFAVSSGYIQPLGMMPCGSIG